MKPIKLAQWGSTIAILTAFLYILIMGALILVGTVKATMADLMTQCVMFVMFVGPEKIVALFGPYLKRQQENGNQK